MKKHLSIILAFVSLCAFAQETQYQKKINSIKNLIAENEKQIQELQLENKKLKDDLKLVQLKVDSIIIKESDSDVLHTTYSVAFYSDIDLNNRLEDIPVNTKVGLLEIIDDTYKILYNNKIGYAKRYSLITDAEFKIKEQEKLQKEKERLKEQELVKQRETEAAKQRQKQIQEDELIRKQALAEKTKKLISKYGYNKGKLVAEGRVSIGMNTNMVIDSWGKPSKINSSIYSFGTKEQWVYGLGNYVYFENGIVTSISTSK